jgi:hypothetical protein
MTSCTNTEERVTVAIDQPSTGGSFHFFSPGCGS